MISGSTVDMARAKQEASFVAEEAKPSEQATVAGQMGELMQDFQGGNTPAWAAGAMRAATAQLAARGLGASSMAGQGYYSGCYGKRIAYRTSGCSYLC